MFYKSHFLVMDLHFWSVADTTTRDCTCDEGCTCVKDFIWYPSEIDERVGIDRTQETTVFVRIAGTYNGFDNGFGPYSAFQQITLRKY